MLKYLDSVNGPNGYSPLSVSPDEVQLIMKEIETHFFLRVNQICPAQIRLFENTPISEYHKIAHLVDHDLLWSEQTHRILPKKSLAKLQELSLFQPFIESPNDFVIGDPQDLGYGELIWRIVRTQTNGSGRPITIQSHHRTALIE